jgi:hypothetical protein
VAVAAKRRLCALAAKLFGPFCVLGEVVAADGRSRSLDGLDEIADAQWGLKQLVAGEICPGFFLRLRIAWRAGCPFRFAVYFDL